MSVLEKILDEIENEAMKNKDIGRKQCEGMMRAMNIIRSHMDEFPNCDNCRRKNGIKTDIKTEGHDL